MKRLFLAGVMGLVALAGCRTEKPAESEVLNVGAKLPAGLPVPVLDWQVISSGVDKVEGAMWMLSGNAAAMKDAAAGSYGEGSVLALTTWAQREDPHWFGARIPSTFVSLETVTVSLGADGKTTAVYKRFAGNPVKRVTDAGADEGRKEAILSMRLAELP